MENSIEIQKEDKVILTMRHRVSNKIKYKIADLEINEGFVQSTITPIMKKVTYDPFAYKDGDGEFHLIPIKEDMKPIVAKVWEIINYRLLSTRLILEYLDYQKRKKK